MGAMTDEPVLVREQRGAVLVLRLNRPAARNALNGELLDQLGLALVEAEADPAVVCVVITGTGDRAFCAGMDLADFAAEGAMAPSADGTAGFRRFTEGGIAVPIIGAANATAVAGGFEVLLGCDLVVASADARFGLPEVKRGLFAAGGGTNSFALPPRSTRTTSAGSSFIQSDSSTTCSRSWWYGGGSRGSTIRAPYRPACSWNSEWLWYQ